MDQEELNRLIAKYQANTLTAEERDRLNAWYTSFNDERVEVPVSEETTEEKVFVELFSRIEKRTHPHKVKRLTITPLVVRIAASVSLLALISAVLILNSTSVYEFLHPIQYAEEYVPPGSRVSLTLSDGSTVVLNSNSWLRYPKVFNRATREVYLEGEAFFDVAKNKEKPFKIHSGKIETTVLGTSFNVRAHGYENRMSVAVLTGKVKVALKGPADLAKNDTSEKVLAILSPYDQLDYNVVTHASAVRKNVARASITSWMDGVLEFRSASVQELERQLENWYGVQVERGDSTLKACTFTGSFKRLPLSRVLDMLAASSGFTYERNGATVLIKGGVPCKQ